MRKIGTNAPILLCLVLPTLLFLPSCSSRADQEGYFLILSLNQPLLSLAKSSSSFEEPVDTDAPAKHVTRYHGPNSRYVTVTSFSWKDGVPKGLEKSGTPAFNEVHDGRTIYFSFEPDAERQNSTMKFDDQTMVQILTVGYMHSDVLLIVDSCCSFAKDG